uniref:Putative perlucin n=1 Tax=Pinctada fucata TaxID=50426 RepID=A0A194AQK7_PINFU
MRNLEYSLLLLATFASVAICCDPGWQKHGSWCFLFGHDAMTWAESAEICREFGGFLAEPSTQDIDSYIMSTTRSTNPKKIFWLGGSDLVQEGKWMWTTTNVPFSYTNWIPTDPNDGDARRHEDCLITNWSGDGKWADAGCEWKEYFLCQKEDEPNVGVIG